MRIVPDEPKRQRRIVRRISNSEEARIQAGIAADPENPEWTAADFKRAKPFAQALPTLAASRRGRGPQKQPTKGRRVAAAHSRGGRALQSRRPWLAVPHGRGLEEGRGALTSM
jgi:hypothetical protein